MVGRGTYYFDTRFGEPQLPASLRIDPRAEPGYDLYIVQFQGPIKESWVRALAGTGTAVFDYLPSFSFVIAMPPSALPQVRSLPFVEWVGVYQPAYKLGPELMPERSGPTAVNVVLFPGMDRQRVARTVTSSGGTTVASWEEGREFHLQALIPFQAIPKLARLREVSWIEGVAQNYPDNDQATWVVQTNILNNRRVHTMGLHGQGQLITMADSGLSYAHEMFADPQGDPVGSNHRKVQAYYVPTGAMGDAIDNIGHGTHVAGTALGDAPDPTGTYATYNKYDGHAFEARIIVQDIMDATGLLSPPSNYNNLFDPAFNAIPVGSRIHTNSWSSRPSTFPTDRTYYSSVSRALDDFMWNHPDFLILFTASNLGPTSNSLGFQAQAKDIVAVGATNNGISANDMALVNSATIGCSTPPCYFSGRGPAADGRLKPEVVAPGQLIASARAPGTTLSGCVIIDANYIRCSGTSMAAPDVAGNAALIRQYYQEGWYPSGRPNSLDGFTPSAALVKATLINSAQEISGADAYGQTSPTATRELKYPNDHQGWGRINLDRALYFAGDLKRLYVVDDRAGLTSLAPTKQYQVEVTDSSQFLNVSLVWTDYPGTAGTTFTTAKTLKNDLDLLVTDPSGVNQYKGNYITGCDICATKAESATGGTYDRTNVEEGVLLLHPKKGIWTISVNAFSLPNGPQPFALVVTGAKEASTTFFDNFDDGDINDWYINFGQYGSGRIVEASTVQALSPAYSLHALTPANKGDSPAQATARFLANMNYSDDYILDERFYLPTGVLEQGVLVADDGRVHADVFTTAQGAVLRVGDYRYSVDVPVTQGTWHRFQAVERPSIGTYDVLLDGLEVASSLPFYYLYNGQPQALRLGIEGGLFSYSGEVFFDNVQYIGSAPRKSKVFGDNFDDGSIADWSILRSGTGIVQASNTRANSLPYSLFIQYAPTDKARATTPYFPIDLSKDYIITFSHYVPKPPQLSSDKYLAVLCDYFVQIVDKSGTFYADQGSFGLAQIGPVTYNTWLKFEVRVNTLATSYDVYLGGTFVGNYRSAGCSPAQTLSFGSKASPIRTDKGEAYWDDITVVGFPM